MLILLWEISSSDRSNALVISSPKRDDYHGDLILCTKYQSKTGFLIGIAKRQYFPMCIDAGWRILAIFVKNIFPAFPYPHGHP